MALPTITMNGRLQCEPDIRYDRDGTATTTLQVKVMDTRGTEPQAHEFTVLAKNKLAENIALSLTSGCSVLIVGALEATTGAGDDGEETTQVQILASAVGLSLARVVDVHDVRPVGTR